MTKICLQKFACENSPNNGKCDVYMFTKKALSKHPWGSHSDKAILLFYLLPLMHAGSEGHSSDIHGLLSLEGTLLGNCAKWINFTKFQFPWMTRDDQWVVLLFDSFILFHLQVSKATTGPYAWEGHSPHPHCLSPYLHATFLPYWMCIDRIMVSPPCIS